MQAISKPPKTEYSQLTLERAKLALVCSPFLLVLFVNMMEESILLPSIAGKNGLEKHYTKRKLPELLVENELSWLIQVGLLRREVDGQGITDSFRLTPLGRQIITSYQQIGSDFPRSSFWERVQNFLTRWFRLPF